MSYLTCIWADADDTTVCWAFASPLRLAAASTRASIHHSPGLPELAPMRRHVATVRVRRIGAESAMVLVSLAGFDLVTAGCDDVVDADADGGEVVVVVVAGVVAPRCVNIFSRKYCNGCGWVCVGCHDSACVQANRIRSSQQPTGGDDTSGAATTTQRHHFIAHVWVYFNSMHTHTRSHANTKQIISHGGITRAHTHTRTRCTCSSTCFDGGKGGERGGQRDTERASARVGKQRNISVINDVFCVCLGHLIVGVCRKGRGGDVWWGGRARTVICYLCGCLCVSARITVWRNSGTARRFWRPTRG